RGGKSLHAGPEWVRIMLRPISIGSGEALAGGASGKSVPLPSGGTAGSRPAIHRWEGGGEGVQVLEGRPKNGHRLPGCTTGNAFIPCNAPRQLGPGPFE